MVVVICVSAKYTKLILVGIEPDVGNASGDVLPQGGPWRDVWMDVSGKEMARALDVRRKVLREAAAVPRLEAEPITGYQSSAERRENPNK